MPRKSTNYVDPKTFLLAFQNYLPVVREARKKWLEKCAALASKDPEAPTPIFERPQTPDYDFIGLCLYKIADHLSSKFNFIKYTFREDMMGDALENSIRYLENFDTEKSNNPFAYFTQVIKWSFFRTIESEGKHSYIKAKILESAADFFSKQAGDDGDYKNAYVEFTRDNKNDIIEDFETKKKLKKKNTKKKNKEEYLGIEKFMVQV